MNSSPSPSIESACFWVERLGCGVQGRGLRVWGSGCRVQGVEFRVWDSGFGV